MTTYTVEVKDDQGRIVHSSQGNTVDTIVSLHALVTKLRRPDLLRPDPSFGEVPPLPLAPSEEEFKEHFARISQPRGIAA